jgi:hypothetical protein
MTLRATASPFIPKPPAPPPLLKESAVDFIHGTTVLFAAATWSCGDQLRVADTCTLDDGVACPLSAAAGPWRSCIYVEHGTSKIARLVTWSASRAMPDPDDADIWHTVSSAANPCADLFGVFDAALCPVTADCVAALDAEAGALTEAPPHFGVLDAGVAVAPSRGTGLLRVMSCAAVSLVDGICLEFEYLDSAL